MESWSSTTYLLYGVDLGVKSTPTQSNKITGIDQLNNKEKEHQVPLMKEIYSKSVRVIIWLGNGDSITHD